MTPAGQLRLAEQCRVVVDNDWAGDPDGLVALAHHLLSPTNRVVAVTSSFLNPVFGQGDGTAQRGAALAQELVDLVGGLQRPPVHTGAEAAFEPGGPGSAASAAIVAAARRDDDLPLIVVCAGPLTNVAAALEQAPDVATRLTLVWVGGALAPEAPEYNRDTDPRAAEAVLAQPDLAVRQFPLETYRRCAYSVAELEHDLAGSGRVGRWLWDRFVELPLPEWVRLGGVWPLGDSPPVLLTALSDESSTSREVPSAADAPARRVYTDVDVRLLFGDMLAKLRRHEDRSWRPGLS
ncbi:Inosine-uridine preferring nucleoside hydrolase [Geodermatophilus telluris]|uniref:Inosine-uridine preferring nucleoside hydrolase n=1 Tax=Geodermatophilus telluris TaxID=1190417 RepID=A0A1G6Q8Z2_9ACTN|nr:nucleoside hydrolase [Geodermatophilus telluris]SDC88799.1 Inosine-uridine preferring nucleoside hydrolase [Geodermatophilus telluris]